MPPHGFTRITSKVSVNPESNRRLVALLWALSMPLPSAVAGQVASDPTVGGTWWEVSAAAGATRLSCLVCDRAREMGPALGVALGAYANPRLRIGIEGGAWTAGQDDDREHVYRAGLVAQLHPNAGSGLHLIAGFGWSGYRLEEITYDAAHLTLGAGWDLPLTGSWVVGNRFTLDASSHAALKNGGTDIESPVGLSVLRFGVYLRKR